MTSYVLATVVARAICFQFEAMSNLLVNFQYIFIYYYFCHFQVNTVNIVGFSSFNRRVPTIVSVCLCVYISPNGCSYIWLTQLIKLFMSF